jgi:hypothetical protein
LIFSLCVTALLLGSCAGPTPDVYKSQLSQASPESPIAIFRAESAAFQEIDGSRLEHPDPNKYYHEAHLPPGPHDVTLRRWFGVSVLVVPRGYIETVSRSFTVDMKADHVYELHADRTTGHGFRVYFWIEDATTKEVVAGTKLKCFLC